MLELFWGILNTVILIYFIIICFKATKIIRDNLGILATLIFVFGLLSFIGKTNEENTKNKTFNLQEETENIERPKFNGNTYLREKKLEDNLMTDIDISISFGENTIEKKLLNANVYRNGFVSGTDWKTTNINVFKLENNTYKYNVTGTVDWRILGIKFYTELKEFDGKIELKK
ncbi:hypothetical protein [Flavobacterium sp. A45]|uniref:hypothetical protein n=1 Tax=Flavobacterium sp. A45 TaxID=1945862 RepID=UPI000986F98B|nr:hypothetical protein [Flavobacterium sp. A45]OOG73443.1 hypothetical protein B0E44_07715 [Flavobacterium sp. A45]